MINRYVISALVIIIIVYSLYFVNFYVMLGYKVSNDSAVWGQLGDYVGGLLNPILSFFSIILLIKSLTLQNAANVSLSEELKNTRQTEKLRSFETLFFNMINSQKQLFDCFSIEVLGATRLRNKKVIGAKAVNKIEDDIEKIKKRSGGKEEIVCYLEKLDLTDQIFGLSRVFYIMVKLIDEKLNDDEGFPLKERYEHYRTLINFTDFSQLRLIMISVQFMEYESSSFLKNNVEFTKTIEELGLGYDMY